MGGELIRHEPTIHEGLLQDVVCEHYFRNHDWLHYFLKIKDFNDEIAVEFMHSFDEGEATVKRLRVIATEQQIAEVIGLLQEGDLFPESKDARSVKAEFTISTNRPLMVDRQGTRRVSLPAHWP